MIFMESPEYDPKNFDMTEFGYALVQEKMPARRDVFWKKLPEGDVYFFDGDGWYEFKPKRPALLPEGDLPHG
jgi:hypothetical protein